MSIDLSKNENVLFLTLSLNSKRRTKSEGKRYSKWDNRIWFPDLKSRKQLTFIVFICFFN